MRLQRRLSTLRESPIASNAIVLAIAALSAGLPNAAFGLIFVRVVGPSAWSIASPLLGLGASAAVISTGIIFALTTSVVRAGNDAPARMAYRKIARPLLISPAIIPFMASFLRLPSMMFATLAVVLFAATLFAAIPVALLLAYGKVRAIAVIATAGALLRFALFLPMAHVAPVSDALLSSIAVTAMGSLAMWIWAVKTGPPVSTAPDSSHPHPDAVAMFPRTALALALYLPLVTPVWLGRHLLASSEAGSIAIGAYVATGVFSLAGAVTSAVIPKISAKASRNAEKAGMALTIGITAPAIVACWLLGPWAISFLTGSSAAEIRGPVVMLGIGALLWSLIAYLSWVRVTRGAKVGRYVAVATIAAFISSYVMVKVHTELAVATGPLVAFAAASCLLALGATISRTRPGIRQLDRHIPVSEIAQIPISVGIMAHNEASMIGHCIKGYLDQDADIREIIVVASGATDGTEEIVGLYATKDLRIRLISESERKGKLAAVQRFLGEATCDVCIVGSADVIPSRGSVAKLSSALNNHDIAMAGPRVIPLRSERNLIARVHSVLWKLHHEVAMRHPKVGEMFAVRRSMVSGITQVAGCDEVIIEQRVTASGGKLAYVPDAVVFNLGPNTVSDYIQQRRRVHAQHLAVRQSLSYSPSTLQLRPLVIPLLQEPIKSPFKIPELLICIGLEVLGRFLGRSDFKKGLLHLTWVASKRNAELMREFD